MYEEFLEKSFNSKRQAVDEQYFIAKYADLAYPELEKRIYGRRSGWEVIVMGCLSLSIRPITKM